MTTKEAKAKKSKEVLAKRTKKDVEVVQKTTLEKPAKKLKTEKIVKEKEEVFVHDEGAVDEAERESAVPAVPKKDRKTVRGEQRTLAAERRSKRSHAEVIEGLRKQWDIIRQKNIDVKDKVGPIATALNIIKDSIHELALKRDASKMIQTIITYADEPSREAIAKEIKGSVNLLAQNTYAIHVLNKLVKESAGCRDILMSGFRGHVDKLFKSKGGCAFLDELYRSLNATKRMSLLAEMYSRELALPGANSAVSLSEIIASNPARRDFVLAQVKQRVETLLQRSLLNYQCVQRIVNEYLSCETFSKSTEMTEKFIEHVQVMTDYQEGCEAIVRIVALSAAKERKAMVKAFKTMLQKLLTEGNKVQIILALLLYVDDTVLMGKALVQEISKDLESVVFSRFSSRAILLVLAGAFSQYITPPMAAFFEKVTPLSETTTKKDAAVKRSELQEYLMPALRVFVKENLQRMIEDTYARNIVTEFLALTNIEEARGLLATFATQHGGLLESFHHANIESFLRSIVKKNEQVAIMVYDIMQTEGFEDHLKGKSGFLFVVMTRYASLTERLRSEIEIIRNTDTDAAKLLLNKLQ